MNKRYQHTIYACFCGFVVQAIVNNFVPLLFVTFSGLYGIDIGRITLMVTINFAIQLVVDLCSVFFVDRIGYRASLVIAHALSTLGLALLAVLPDIMPDPYTGLMICVVFYAIGGGLLEVVISPVMEACPTENKASAMSLLHSFYCWGHVAVVLLSTLFFLLFGIENWRIPALIWAVVPLINMIAFTRVPINKLPAEASENTDPANGTGKSGFRGVIR
ncbi:MAG: MFS transporter, partial [Clostridiales bacterium]|nr:MFS transporter [Clostridiales bacterium]